jgi:hypothetical protein
MATRDLRAAAEQLGATLLAAEREDEREFPTGDVRARYRELLQDMAVRVAKRPERVTEIFAMCSAPARRALLETAGLPRQLVVQSLDDPDPDTRRAATYAIRTRVAADVRPALERRLRDPETRHQAFDALVTLDPAYCRRLVDADPELADLRRRLVAERAERRARWSLEQRLFAAGAPLEVLDAARADTAALLAPLLEDDSDDVRRRALAALAELDRRDAALLLERHLVRSSTRSKHCAGIVHRRWYRRSSRRCAPPKRFRTFSSRRCSRSDRGSTPPKPWTR